MRVLSHRGYWRDPAEKNSLVAFERSFAAGFGTELDIRDHDGALVVAHDVPEGSGWLPLDELLALRAGFEGSLPLAINIKADGLQSRLADSIRRYELADYFVFDMSVPDTLGYLDAGLRSFTRHSEWEPQPPLYTRAVGVWVDQFETDWVTVETVRGHVEAGKEVCIVSPELHGRDPKDAWSRYAGDGLAEEGPDVLLCTDSPEEARAIFGG